MINFHANSESGHNRGLLEIVKHYSLELYGDKSDVMSPSSNLLK